MREPFLKSRVLKIFISHLVKSILFLALQPFSCFSNQHPPQIEEGFRWRHNLNIHLHTEDNQHVVIPTQNIHEEMSEHEKSITHALARQFEDCNVAIAKLTLVVQAEGQNLYYKTDWLNSLNGRHCYFPSKSAAGFLGGNGHPLNGNWIKIGNEEDAVADMRDHLVSMKAEPFIGHQGLNDANGKIILGDDDAAFLRNFMHSEQKLVRYLWPAEGHMLWNDADLPIKNRITNMLNGIPFNRVKAAVFHVHSRYDICSKCRFSLTVFSHKVRQAFRAIHPNMHFILSASSRVNYEKERWMSGHDGRYRNVITKNIGQVQPINGWDALIGANPNILNGWHNLPLQVGNPPNVHPVVVNPLLIDVPGALQPSQAAPGNLVGEIIGFYTTVSDFPSLQQWNTLLPIAD